MFPFRFNHTNALIVGWPTALAGSCTMVMRRKVFGLRILAGC